MTVRLCEGAFVTTGDDVVHGPAFTAPAVKTPGSLWGVLNRKTLSTGGYPPSSHMDYGSN